MSFWNEQILQRVTSDFLQRATSATSNERILQRATSATSYERILQRVILRVTSNKWISTSNEQRVKSYASKETKKKKTKKQNMYNVRVGYSFSTIVALISTS